MTCTANRTVTQPEWDGGGNLDNTGIADSDETDPVQDLHRIPMAIDGRIEIELQLTPSLADIFSFTGATATSLGDDGVFGIDVRPGSYQTQSARAALVNLGWLVQDFTCDDGNSTVNLLDLTDVIANYNVEAGETVRCTLSLMKVANDVPIPVNSNWALLMLILSMLAMGWYFRPEQVRKTG